MQVDTMRKIDRYLGIAICFILSAIDRFKRLLVSRKEVRAQRALFIELSEMGSAILADPAMRYLREKTGCELFFVIFKKNKPSLRLLKTIPEDNIFTIREGNLLVFTLDTVRFLLWTRRTKIDAVVDLELFSRFTAILSYLSGASLRAGFYRFHQEGLYRGSLLTHKVSYNPHLHIAGNFLALVYPLTTGEKQEPFTKARIPDGQLKLPGITYTKEEKNALLEKVKRFFPEYDRGFHKIILINPNASEMLVQRRWPMEYYRELVSKILKASERIVVLITGDSRERVEAEGLVGKVNDPRLVNFAGALTLEELPVLYSISEFMVTNDSGPAHFASVTSMPTYVFFGPETPLLYRSLGETRPIYAEFACSPCVSAYNHRKTICRDNLCLKSLAPEYVFGLLKDDLEKIDGAR